MNVWREASRRVEQCSIWLLCSVLRRDWGGISAPLHISIKERYGFEIHANSCFKRYKKNNLEGVRF